MWLFDETMPKMRSVHPQGPACTFATTVYERTYRQFLQTGYISRLASQHGYPFAEKLLVINNVADRTHVVQLAEESVQRGEIDRFVFVADEIEAAASALHISLQQLGSLRHYSDHEIVSLYAAHTDWVVHQDIEVYLTNVSDWIGNGIRTMLANDALLVCTPMWTDDKHAVLQEQLSHNGDYMIGYGFSDQLFLVQRLRFLQPIYHEFHFASLRYPLVTKGRIFEAMVDSYMRRHHLFRLVDLQTTYHHGGDEGASYPQTSFVERMKLRVFGPLARMGMRLSNLDRPRAQRTLHSLAQQSNAATSSGNL